MTKRKRILLLFRCLKNAVSIKIDFDIPEDGGRPLFNSELKYLQRACDQK